MMFNPCGSMRAKWQADEDEAVRNFVRIYGQGSLVAERRSPTADSGSTPDHAPQGEKN